MESIEFEVDTSARRLVDLTAEVADTIPGAADGLAHIFAPHATAGLALVETGAGSEEDLLDAVERLLPRDDRYRHAHGSVGHGADHLLPALIAPFLVVPVTGGTLALGTWQRIVLVDLNDDNPRRRVRVSFLPG